MLLNKAAKKFKLDIFPQRYTTEEEPLRAELFSMIQMEQHGKSLASSHQLSSGLASNLLLNRLSENEDILHSVRRLLTKTVKEKLHIEPAGEWLLDNFYLIEEHIRIARKHLPKSYSRQLPHLQSGPSAGLPRVYDIALDTISYGDGRVDPESLSSFVTAYQNVSPLKLGELWAIPIMLRFALIENLRRLAARIAYHRKNSNLANEWADRMSEMAEKDPQNLILVLADMARSGLTLVSSFVAEFTRRLQGHGPALVLPMTWLEQRLADAGLTIQQLVQSETQKQAVDQVSMSNSITSLRFLGAMDWGEFVETMSFVEQTLRKDIDGVYGRMDFHTRDNYRHVVEKISKNSKLSEMQIAEEAINLAKESAAKNGNNDRTAHVGYYLIGKGLSRLEREAKVNLSIPDLLRKLSYKFPLLLYAGTIILLTLILTGLSMLILIDENLEGWVLWLTGIATLIGISQLSVSLVNWWVTILIPPNRLPRMNFSQGIPSEFRTFVVVPTIPTDEQDLEDILSALEVRFLANRMEHLHFGLLTDFLDASTETIPQDEKILQLARQGIDDLNKKYSGSKGDTFFLFHRPRLWNPKEKKWMGYERKRGKLSDLNSFLLSGSGEKFSLIAGDTTVLSNIKYVITLDTDTQLPRDSAWQLVGTMAHPLNHARYNEKKNRVCEGYGILQPLVSVSLPSTNRSLYARINGSEAGLDPYTRAVSNVYQDLFGEGSFTGKGIYDVEAFEKTINKRFPENQILSHDLLEGCYARSGFLSDIQLYEEYPTTYNQDVIRRLRWIRGDWQIARWLLPKVRGINKVLERNPISALSYWKIFDNLRRSLVPVALTLLLILGWAVLPSAVFWTMAVLGIIMIPSMLAIISEALQKPEDIHFRQHILTTFKSASKRIIQAAFIIICLPYEAYFSLKAIAITIWRMWFTHKLLLEWNPSHIQNRNRHGKIITYFRAMYFAPIVVIVCFIYPALTRPNILILDAPILIIWLISPFIAWTLSQPFVLIRARLTSGQKIFLRKIARKTWGFFEVFVNEGDNWLPPDNYQEEPSDVIAHRTSPTNMGLSLLANLSAYDFGYITVGQLLERTGNTYQAMLTMEHFKGHFYNWYDTQTLNPLYPLYVSTVDSGNLTGHLLTLRQGLITLPNQEIFSAQFYKGLKDTLGVFTDAYLEEEKNEKKKKTDKQIKSIIESKIALFEKKLDSAFDSAPPTLSELKLFLEKLSSFSADIDVSIDTGTESQNSHWAHALARQCEEALNELNFLAPWMSTPDYELQITKFSILNKIHTLNDISGLEAELIPEIRNSIISEQNIKEKELLEDLHSHVKSAIDRANDRIANIEKLAVQTFEFTLIDYDFLFDKPRNLFAIGYNVDQHRKDSSNYDLLASEVRLCNFLAISQGKIPQDSWFALGRQLTATGGEPTLLSWSGSMFEYLMPLLVMPTYENTLLDQSNKAAVKRQIEYGRQRGVPWGISESGYYSVDVQLNYQYRAFGVPGLGFKRGLADDLVIAPYASALALMVAPEAACENLERLSEEGFEGNYGFYEAIDFTPARLSKGQTNAIVKSFMTHHQGMVLLSLNHAILSRPMQKRFESDPQLKATILLLQERIPKSIVYYSQASHLSETRTTLVETDMPMRIIKSPDTPNPELQLLSNGRYHVMVTNSGGGYSQWNELALTRWREDSTSDNWGTFCFIRDVVSGEFWSNTFHPTLKQPKNYEVVFSMGRAEFKRRGVNFDTHTEIVVSPEDDIELRRVRITNRTRSLKTIAVTSYAEIVMSSPHADQEHPAFNNLFVQTEILDDKHSILCKRRPRSNEEKTPLMFHLMSVHGADTSEFSYETDRMEFIGRGNTISEPNALLSSPLLSNSQGSVLDPIVAIQCMIILEPEGSAIIDIVSGIGETREQCLNLIEKYKDQRLADRVIELSWTHSQVTLRHINATEADAQLYGRLASSVIYANSSLRAEQAVLIKNQRGQPGLWSYSISGDLPIVLLQIEDPANISLVQQLIQAHSYWSLKGLKVDLVILNEDHSGYRQLLHDQILGIISGSLEANMLDKKGGIFVRTGEQIPYEDNILLQSVARIIISDKRGTLAEQIKQKSKTTVPIPLLNVNTNERAANKTIRDLRLSQKIKSKFPIPERDLIFFNGFGGFTTDGREYVINTQRGNITPAPWVNVLSNKGFGTILSASGSVYSWFENAHEMRLTPWFNEPVSEPTGEVIYIRDEDSGSFWSPTPLPCMGYEPYVSRHGFGYSVFEHTEDDIRTEVWIYVAIDEPVKYTVLKVRNLSERGRRLSATGYVEWVLGDLRTKTNMHLITEIDSNSGAIFAQNRYNTDSGNLTAFFDTDDPIRSITCDRTEFIGRNNTLRNPVAMTKAHLSGKTGAALDSCSAIQVRFDLAGGQERDIIFRMGAETDAEKTSSLVNRTRGSSTARKALEKVWEYWNRTLGAVQAETPDPSLNVLTNGWLLYQTLSSRFMARTGYYQSSGAIGFRDQLQDSMALIYAEPAIVRDHLLHCASRQFREGDVQHWWHPSSGKGVRTRCSDDYLWLPLAVSHYVLTTGDTGILDETIHFIEGRQLNIDEDSYFDLPVRSNQSASLYEHCVKAIQKGLSFGEHGLPLMGSCDWNDGMNLVGIHGRGESVWLAFFFHKVLEQFIQISKIYEDNSFAERCQKEAEQLRINIKKHAWDGEWFLRAFFDNGTPLGSSKNEECKIDAIAQSWSVLSGAADINLSKKAMESLNKRLVQEDTGLIQLLDPPFDKSDLNPGYIKGYLPGVRENGGQYTHAAVWAVMAFAALGNYKRAWELMTMLNPVNHGNTPEKIAIYKVEPYVVAADVYAFPPHAGRGGWTWYTGSSAWMYRLIIESLLGLKLDIDKLHINPCIPGNWDSYKLHYRYRETVYHISILQKVMSEEARAKSEEIHEINVIVDGKEQADNFIHLVDDRHDHFAEIKVNRACDNQD